LLSSKRHSQECLFFWKPSVAVVAILVVADFVIFFQVWALPSLKLGSGFVSFGLSQMSTFVLALRVLIPNATADRILKHAFQFSRLKRGVSPELIRFFTPSKRKELTMIKVYLSLCIGFIVGATWQAMMMTEYYHYMFR